MNNFWRNIESHYITFYNVQDTIKKLLSYKESGKYDPFSRDKTIKQDEFQNDKHAQVSRHEF